MQHPDPLVGLWLQLEIFFWCSSSSILSPNPILSNPIQFQVLKMAKALDFLNGSDDDEPKIKKQRQFNSNSNSTSNLKGKSKANPSTSTSTSIDPNKSKTNSKSLDDESDGDDDAEFIATAIHKANKKAGTEVVKAAAESDGKNKNNKGKINKNKVNAATKGTTGGGSFQSMGEYTGGRMRFDPEGKERRPVMGLLWRDITSGDDPYILAKKLEEVRMEE